MINKRGKIIALVGGSLILLFILIDSTDSEILTKDSFYDTISETDQIIDISKKDKKKASLNFNEDEKKESSQSYQRIERNRKDQSFSLYRELLETKKKEAVKETIVALDREEFEKQKNTPLSDTIETEKVQHVQKPIAEIAPKTINSIKRVQHTQIKSVEKATSIQQQEVLKEQTQPVEEKRTFRRKSSSRKPTTTPTIAEAPNAIYIKAEIYSAVNVDMRFPPIIDIRVLEEKEVSLPNGQSLSYGKLLKGIPTDGGKTLNIKGISKNYKSGIIFL